MGSDSGEGEISRFEFDTQAEGYDLRTRLGEDAARAVADVVLGLGQEALDVSRPLVVLEVGAGTGEIGAWLARASTYTGFDASSRMLSAFETRLASSETTATLRVADANDPWPLADTSAEVVFFSRVLHLLDPRHVEQELRRVAGDDGLVVLAGRTQRDRSSRAAALRRMLWTALEDRGFSPRRGERRASSFFEEMVSRGAIRLPAREAATIEVVRSPLERLRAWRSKGGLGGLDLPRDERARVLDEVEARARQTWSRLDEPERSAEVYVVEGALLSRRNSGSRPRRFGCSGADSRS